jgi:hypothetical protein
MSDAKDNISVRIALAHRNILDLTQRAAIANGAAAEENIAALLERQQAVLNDLLKQQETLEAAKNARPDGR